MPTIDAKEKAIREVFHRDYAFSIPPYQRPYSWGTDQAKTLLSDLVAASATFQVGMDASKVTPYFLGSIVVIKQQTQPEAQVIDGQQRLTTLSLLLSALRTQFPNDDDKATFQGLILEKGNPLVGTTDRCRLVLRERDHAFFESNFLRHPKQDHLKGLLTGKLSDPQRHLTENSQALLDEVAKLDSSRRESLAAFLLQHTYLVVVSTASLESAFRIFSVLNDRGLDLTVADILKSEIIGRLPSGQQIGYVEKWEDAEEELGTQSFADLFSHIRMIHDRKKLRTTVLEGFRAAVPISSPAAFIDDELLPFSDATQVILQADFECADPAVEKAINRSLRWLLRVGDRDWMPVALRLLTHYSATPKLIDAKITELEQLAAILWLSRFDENSRIERYGKILEEIKNDTSKTGNLPSLGASKEEKKCAADIIDGDIYNLSPKPKRTFVLLRLDAALSSGEASYDFDTITVEHVLPQTPDANSQWLQWWPDATTRQGEVHRLGNLALLNRRQNSAAKNWEFDVKKTKYFQKKTGGSPFQITSRVLKETEWTPTVLARHQMETVAKLKEIWEL
ncbi:MAG: DUF262 domain-containing HNH endonuclease family protein [Limisphaerales bacterium]